jgi:hypothetical protein
MRNKLFYSLVMGLVLACFYSFTVVKPAPVKPAKKAAVTRKFTCNATVTIGSKVYNGDGTVTITWSGTNASYYTYGGYYRCSTTGGFGSTTYSTSVTIPVDCGGTLNVTARCYDGSLGTYFNTTF